MCNLREFCWVIDVTEGFARSHRRGCLTCSVCRRVDFLVAMVRLDGLELQFGQSGGILPSLSALSKTARQLPRWDLDCYLGKSCSLP